MPVIAIVGAGPGMGLAIARTFGSRGFDVALISRNQAKLDGLVSDLGADGIKAAAFPADVLDHQALTRASTTPPRATAASTCWSTPRYRTPPPSP